jgi:endonuclease G
MIHPYWDMALLRVDGLAADRPALRLSVRAPEDLEGADVVVIGYPARDDRNDLDVQDRIFQRTYFVKRFQPGKIRARAHLHSFESTVDAMTHDSSTLGGNSGSAVVDVATGEVVGLHFAGEYLDANYAVPTYDLARDGRVAALGLGFTGAVLPTGDYDAAWRRAEPTEALPVTVQVPSAITPGAAHSAESGAVTFTIPIQVTIAVGQPTRAGGDK